MTGSWEHDTFLRKASFYIGEHYLYTGSDLSVEEQPEFSSVSRAWIEKNRVHWEAEQARVASRKRAPEGTLVEVKQENSTAHWTQTGTVKVQVFACPSPTKRARLA